MQSGVECRQLYSFSDEGESIFVSLLSQSFQLASALSKRDKYYELFEPQITADTHANARFFLFLLSFFIELRAIVRLANASGLMIAFHT